MNDQPGGPEQSAANDLNSIGQVVGWADFAESAAASHAFLWNPSQPNYFLGSLFDLGDLPGGSDQSIAHGINSRGQVVGEGSVESGPHAFLWSPTSPNATSGTMIDLGDLVGSGGVSSARDINSRGIVVGHSGSAGEERAFVWMPTAPNGATGTMIDLNTLLDPRYPAPAGRSSLPRQSTTSVRSWAMAYLIAMVPAERRLWNVHSF